MASNSNSEMDAPLMAAAAASPSVPLAIPNSAVASYGAAADDGMHTPMVADQLQEETTYIGEDQRVYVDKSNACCVVMPLVHVLLTVSSMIMLLVSLSLYYIVWGDMNQWHTNIFLHDGNFYRTLANTSQARAMGVIMFIIGLLTVIIHLSLLRPLYRTCKSHQHDASQSTWNITMMAMMQATCGTIVVIAAALYKPIIDPFIQQIQWSWYYSASYGGGYYLYFITGMMCMIHGWSILLTKKLTLHGASLLLTLIWITSGVASASQYNGGRAVLIIICIVAYIAYLIEALRSDTMKYLNQARTHGESEGGVVIPSFARPNDNGIVARHIWLNPTLYIIMSIMGLSWPYRAALSTMKDEQDATSNGGGGGANNEFMIMWHKHAIPLAIFNLMTVIVCIAAMAISGNGNSVNYVLTITAIILYFLYLWEAMFSRTYQLISQHSDLHIVHSISVFIGIAWPVRGYFLRRVHDRTQERAHGGPPVVHDHNRHNNNIIHPDIEGVPNDAAAL